MISKIMTIAAAAFIMSASLVTAATVDINTIDGVWTNVGPTTGINGSGTDTISWGTGPDGPSSYVFTAAGTPITDALSPFYIGEFTHNNNPIYASGTMLTNADLQVHMTGTIDGTAFDMTSTFTFLHDETPNIASQCPYSPIPCPDIVTISNAQNLSDIVNVGGVDYTIALSGFLQNGVYTTQFLSQEGQANSAELFASVTSTVPLPSTGLLLLGGLGLMGAARLRRKS